VATSAVQTNLEQYGIQMRPRRDTVADYIRERTALNGSQQQFH